MEQRHIESDSQGMTTRRSFLKRAGTTLAVGLGIALIPAGRASALGSHCCPQPDCDNIKCTSGSPFTCYDACAQRSCCACLTGSTCVDVVCGACQ